MLTSDKFRDECGVVAIHAHPEAEKLAYLGLHALQHRGQESAGIVTSDGERLRQHKAMGLVADIFGHDILASMRGVLAIGHTRYSTAGDSALLNAQPIMVQSNKGTIAIAHNGNLVNAQAIRAKLEGQGSIFQTSSDTEGMAKVARHTVRTRDPVLAQVVMAETYARHRPLISGSSAEFRFSFSTAETGPICVDAMRHSMSFRAGVEPLYDLTAGSVAEGTTTICCGGEEERFGPGDVLLYPYGAGYDIQWTNFDQGLLRVRFEAVAELAAQSTGTDPGQFRFLGMRPVSPAMAAHWRSVAAFVHREMAGDEPAIVHPLVLAETEHVVAAAALSVFPNTTLTVAHAMPEGQVGPAALRRAAAYIDAHAGQPLTLGDIASSVGVGPRALQRAFARHRDTTPMGYLRRVRLENAHRDLRRADPGSGDSVTRIARRWGFGKPARFATDYQRVYGVSPDQTLRGP